MVKIMKYSNIDKKMKYLTDKKLSLNAKLMNKNEESS